MAKRGGLRFRLRSVRFVRRGRNDRRSLRSSLGTTGIRAAKSVSPSTNGHVELFLRAENNGRIRKGISGRVPIVHTSLFVQFSDFADANVGRIARNCISNLAMCKYSGKKDTCDVITVLFFCVRTKGRSERSTTDEFTVSRTLGRIFYISIREREKRSFVSTMFVNK